jgi:hypothetical protein
MLICRRAKLIPTICCFCCFLQLSWFSWHVKSFLAGSIRLLLKLVPSSMLIWNQEGTVKRFTTTSAGECISLAF